ncbi:MAG: hypothetical protein FJW80_09060 [Actinobacteria bacterium]|nr:hypothetical protein [Actinomycetota bacterium]
MRSTTRRAIAIAAAGLIAVAGAGVLSACGSSGGGSESSSAAPAPTDEGAQVIGPVIVEPGQTSAEVAVGRVVTFNVDDVMAWMISSSDEAVLKVTAGKDDGSAQFLPGGEALAPGTAEVTLTNMDTSEEWVVTVSVTQ